MVSHVRLFETPRTVAHQAPPSTGFSRQEYWSGLPFPSPGDLPDRGIKPATLVSPALAGKFFTTGTTWEVVNVGNIEDSLLNMTSKAENRKKNNDTLDGMGDINCF